MAEAAPAPHSRRSTVTSTGESIAESISLPSEQSAEALPRQPIHDNKSHEEIFNQHNDQIQQIFDNRHHDINFDDDGTASWDDESFGNSSLESFDDASLSELRSALIARRQRILDEGSVSKRRRGHSLDRSLGSLSFASLTGSLTSLTRRKKKKKDKDKDKKKKKKKKKKHKEREEKDKSNKKKKDSDGKKSKHKDADEGSLKQLKNEKRQKNDNDSGTLGTSGTFDKSGRSSWDPDKSSKSRSLFNLNLKSPLSSDHNMSISQGGGNDSHTFVFYACDENTGCCAFHPEVQLRKKARLGGWVDVLKQCPKCNDPKEGGPSRNRGYDNSSLRKGDDNASWRRVDDNASWRRREDDNSSLRRRDDVAIQNPRSEQNLKPRRRGEDYARELDRSKSTRQPELSSRHLDRDRAREKSHQSSEYETRGHRPRTERDNLPDRRESRTNRPRESNHDSREASRRDMLRGPSKRDLHPHSSRPGHRRTTSDIDKRSQSELRPGASSRHISSNHPSRRDIDRDPSERAPKDPSSRRIHESSSRHRPRQKRKESSSSSDSSSSSSSESFYARPQSKRPSVKEKKSVPVSKEKKTASKGKDGHKPTNKSKNNPAPSHRRQHSDRENSSRKIERENSHKSASKTSRGRTLSPPKVKSSHQIPAMGAIHQQLRRHSSRSRVSGGSGDVFIDPTYKYAKELCQNSRSGSPSRDVELHSSKPDTRRERTRSPPRRQSTGGSGRSKPVVFKPVDFNPPPTSAPHDDSYHSFNESIDFASYRQSSRESLDDMFREVYSTETAKKTANNVFDEVIESESLADSNFSNTLGDGSSDGKAPKEEGLSSFFKDTIQSKNPELFHTINKILEEEQSDNNNSLSKRLDRLSMNVGHAHQPSQKERKQSMSNSAFVDPNHHNISLSSLNVSEPSLLETSTDNSPIIPEMPTGVSAHRKTQSFHPDILSHSDPDPIHKEKSKSVYPGTAASSKVNIDVSERSYFSEERSATSSFSRKDGLKQMSKEEMMAFASFESMARKTSRSKSFGKSSFNTKSSGATPVENEHRHADISTSLINQMVNRLGSIGSGEGSEGGTKGMDLKDLMQYYEDKDDASGSNNSATIVTNLRWKDIGFYSGQVNDKIEPHGEGKLVMYTGATLYGHWQNGKPHSGPESGGPKSVNGDEVEKKESDSKHKNHKKSDSHDTPFYKLGDEGRKRDMIKDEDKTAAIARISKLQKGNAAFIRRSDGTWTFSRLKKLSKDTAYFVVNPSGSTKSYKAKYWYSHIRACKIPEEKLPPYDSPKQKSSNSNDEVEMSDSELSELANMFNHPMLEETAPDKPTTPPRTFEIKEVREYEPTKNRFSIKDLKPPPRETQHDVAKKRDSQYNEESVSNDSRNNGRQGKRGSTVDTSESSRDTTQDDCSTSKGVLRKGRFSFNQEGPSPCISMRRNVSFCEEKETRSYVKDVPDDISTKTEDEDDNFDVNGTISSNRAGEYNLKGIEP